MALSSPAGYARARPHVDFGDLRIVFLTIKERNKLAFGLDFGRLHCASYRVDAFTHLTKSECTRHDN
jgi:hypothetical protein